MEFLILIFGFIFLIKGADLLIEGAGSIAKIFGIPTLIIGLTIVAFGTSAPELVVNIMSAISGETDLALSNVIGSNISNILLILGITSLIYPIFMPDTTIKNEIPFMIFVSALLLGFLHNGLLSRIESLILIIFFILFLYYIYKSARKNIVITENSDIKIISKTKSIIFIILGLVGLILGGKFIVDSSVTIATNFGLPKSFIGITILAIGTSLPELATCIMAAIKKNTDLALGGIVGSNIFNILWILGISGVIKPLAGYNGINVDLMIQLFISLFIFVSAFTFRKKILGKLEGAILLTLYIIYLFYLIINI